MTEVLEKEFSRRSFLKRGGSLVVGLSVVGASVAGNASASDSPYTIVNQIDVNQVDSFIAIHANNTASIKTGRVELGQGSPTGLLQIAAEELDMSMSQVVFVRTDTDLTPDTGQTAASNSITSAGPRIRSAAASAKEALLGLAAAQLGVPVAALTVSKGVVSGGGKSVTYGALIGDKLFNVRMASPTVNPGTAPAKSASQYTLVGTRPARIDIPDKVTGTYTFVQNIRVPGMLHGRRVLPRGQMVFGFVAPVLSVDESSIKHVKGARVVRRGNFVGVVAPQEYDAIQAAAQLKVKWDAPPPALQGDGNTFKMMRAQDGAGGSVQSYRVSTGDTEAGLSSAAQRLSQTYAFPFNSMAGLAPDCAVADVRASSATILCSSSHPNSSRAQLASLLGLPQGSVRVVYYESSSTFGNQQTANIDIPQAAALMSQLAGAPVRLQHMRWDEHGWLTYSPGELVDIRGGVDSKGNIVGYHTTAFYPQYKNSAGATEELIGTTTPGSAGTGGVVNPAPMYRIDNQRFLLKSLPLVNNWFRVHWNRGGSSVHITFASEQMIDELAHSAGMDPIAFRVQNVTQDATKDRLLAVMNAVTKAANWQPRVAASKLSDATVVTGRGFSWSNAYAANSPAAAVADIEVNKKTGKIAVKQIWAAASAGLTVNPALVENQIEGAMVVGTSRGVVEQLGFNKTNVTSLDWVTYPMLRFKDSPKVTAIIVQYADQPASSVGEAVSVPAPAAIANAFFDATGVRIRQAPMTPARVRAVLGAAGM